MGGGEIREHWKFFVSAEWQPDWQSGSSHITVGANRGGPSRHWLSALYQSILQQRKPRLREKRQLAQSPSNKWLFPTPGLMGELEPLRMFEQEHDQARLRKGRHLGKSQTALKQTDSWAMTLMCEPELSLCKMELKMWRGAPGIGLAQGLAWWVLRKYKREHWYCHLMGSTSLH